MDKKQQQIALFGGLGAVLLIAAAAFYLTRGSGDSTETTSPGTTNATRTGREDSIPGMPGAPDMKTGTGRGAGSVPTPMGMQTPGGQASPGAAAGAPAAPPKKIVSNIRHPKDPFFVTWKVKPPPPYVFDQVEPIRLASRDIEAPPPPNTEVREVPGRRVSGIMSGEGVFAILEGAGDVEIVKPGSETKDGYRVVSINADSVKLQKKEGNVLRTQVVMLSDIPPGAQTASYQPGGGFGEPGMPGRPGFGGPAGGPSIGAAGRAGGGGARRGSTD